MPRTGSRSPSRRFYNWRDIIAAARAANGAYALLIPDAPRSVVKTIRLRRAADLVLDDGHLEAYADNEYRNRDGHWQANIYIRFVPVTLSGEDEPPTEE